MNPQRSNRREFLQQALGVTGMAASLDYPVAGKLHGSRQIPADQATSAASQAGTKQIYGFLADAARLPERPDYYERLIDFCSDWNLNALQFRLTDDQGSALRFRSHPELITHRNAFTPDQMRALVEYGEKRGVTLIPEIESFGHTHYITGVPRYADLSDHAPGGRSEFTGIIPVHPQTLAIFRDLYREIAEIFVSPYIHGGCDEVSWGGSEISQQALKKHTRTEIWASYVNSLDEITRGAGKELIVWGDHVLRLEPEVLSLLNKDVIVMDWNYEDEDPAALRKLAEKVVASGHRAMGAPGLIYCRWGPRPGNIQLNNLDAYAEAYRGLNGSMGVIVTNWIPSRYLASALWDGIAYSAITMREGSSTARHTAFRRFVEKHYAAEWNGIWDDVLTTIYNNAPYSPSCCGPWMQPPLIAPWRNEADLAATIKTGLVDPPPYTRLRSQLVLCAGGIRRNLDDFAAFELTVEYLEHLFWRSTSVVREAQRKDGSQASAEMLIRTIAARDQEILEKLDADWDRTRPGDSPGKQEALFGLSAQDQLLFYFRQAAAGSAQLAAQPERFSRLL